VKKILKSGLNVCVISLLVACSSCQQDFDWVPKPWVGDSKKQQLVDFNNVTVKCNQPAFDKFTCFDADNIAELKTAIDKVNLSEDDRKSINKLFERVMRLKVR